LQIRSKFPQVPGRLAAAPASHQVVVWTNSYGRLDAKSGQRTTFETTNVPAVANMGIRTMVLSPDGKYLCVQGSDYTFHRMRVSDNKLIHEGSLPPISKSPGAIGISPDSQRVTFGAIVPSAKTTTGIYAIDNWNAPLVSMPIRLRRLSLDSKGGVWGESSPGYLRYYANPEAAVDVKDLKIAKMKFAPTQVLTPPRGDGCLVVYQEGTNQRAAWLTVAK
jgi:WD40 repeat protein